MRAAAPARRAVHAGAGVLEGRPGLSGWMAGPRGARHGGWRNPLSVLRRQSGAACIVAR
ncbi:hypothetical protein BDI4_1900003 [Burkholderia diffusa]|nr:hypothetical protein BDI4_1900003 [Burkholderia diffusa]